LIRRIKTATRLFNLGLESKVLDLSYRNGSCGEVKTLALEKNAIYARIAALSQISKALAALIERSAGKLGDEALREHFLR
jgi:hypothetical protein